jgi:hypothetical protein
MNTSILRITTASLLFFASVSIFSCKKKEATPDEPAATTTSGTTTLPGSFVWQEDGGTAITADSAFWTTGAWGTGIRASKGGFTNYFEINWDTTNNVGVGVRIIPVAGFTFLKGSATYTNAAAQSLSITASSTPSGSSYNIISGNFTMAVSGGTIMSISATFSDLPYKP